MYINVFLFFSSPPILSTHIEKYDWEIKSEIASNKLHCK